MKYCTCVDDYGVWVDLDVIRCSWCYGSVGKRRATEFILANTPIGKDPEKLSKFNNWERVK